MESKDDKVSEFDLGALGIDLLERDSNETEGGGANETLVLMKPSSFMLPTKEASSSLSTVKSMSLMEAHQGRDTSKLLCEFPRRRTIDEWERY